MVIKLMLACVHMFTKEKHDLVESVAEMLSYLIHVRYVLTTKGQTAMVSIVS